MFSRRIPSDLRPNRLARAREATGPVRFDLTVSNPTGAGLPYPADLLAPLGDPGGLAYAPDPRGLRAAREAIAEREGLPDPDHVVLTASTSEAYGFLFRLLCDPGDEVLVPVPSYPLFEHLAALDAVRTRPYRLLREDGWQPDSEGLGGAVRAVLAVHPNNPTGSCLSPEGAAVLAGFCARTGAALVVDEVFREYPMEWAGAPPSLAGREDVLTFTLGGLSKSAGLPQVKLGWIVVSGTAALRDEALARLAYVADTYLSVNTPVQRALPELLSGGAGVAEAIRSRGRANLTSLRRALSSLAAIEVPPVEAGWTACVRIPGSLDEEELALALLREDGVAVQPGYFYDFPTGRWLVVSLLPPEAVFAEGAGRLASRLAARLR